MRELKQLEDRYASLDRALQREIGAARTAQSVRDGHVAEIEQLSEQIELLRKVLALFHSLSEEAQEEQYRRIEKIVSLGLRAVFSENIAFSILQEVKGNASHVSFTITDESGVATSLLGSRGGGLVGCVGVILQIIFVRLLQPQVAPVVFLDEPFSQLSAEYVRPMGALLAKLVNDMGLQVVLVTHQPEFFEYGDKTYRFERDRQGRTHANGVD